MDTSTSLSTARDKLLFTPGPLTTSLSVKQAMLHDAGSWHFDFNRVVRGIQDELLRVAELAPKDGFDVVLMQGSGTFGVESVLSSTVPPDGKVLVIANGAYGERIAQMAACLRLDHSVLRFPENGAAEPEEVALFLARHPGFSHLAVVHCETTTGLLNPIQALGAVARQFGLACVVDAMSSFGAIPIDMAGWHLDYLVSSANKCIEGVPGFSFVFARREHLLRTDGWARSLSLDLLGQLKGFEKNGQFRFTPPTHSILAFTQALRELALEGGVRSRGQRYGTNHRRLLSGMETLGFRAFLRPELQSFIITAFHYPENRAFDFPAFYRELSDAGFLIYPGKLTAVDTFRIGTIGRIFPRDIDQLLHAISDALRR